MYSRYDKYDNDSNSRMRVVARAANDKNGETGVSFGATAVAEIKQNNVFS